jgi:hypothetical protein
MSRTRTQTLAHTSRVLPVSSSCIMACLMPWVLSLFSAVFGEVEFGFLEDGDQVGEAFDFGGAFAEFVGVVKVGKVGARQQVGVGFDEFLDKPPPARWGEGRLFCTTNPAQWEMDDLFAG